MVTSPVGRETVDDLLAAVLAGLRGPGTTSRSSTCRDLRRTLEETLSADPAESGSVSRVVNALRSAHADLGAHQIQDAYLCLLCARELIDR